MAKSRSEVDTVNEEQDNGVYEMFICNKEKEEITQAAENVANRAFKKFQAELNKADRAK